MLEPLWMIYGKCEKSHGRRYAKNNILYIYIIKKYRGWFRIEKKIYHYKLEHMIEKKMNILMSKVKLLGLRSAKVSLYENYVIC